MNGNVTWETLSWVIGICSIVGAIVSGFLWKIHYDINGVKREAYEKADKNAKDIADLKAEIPEKYVSKSDHSEGNSQLLRAIEGLAGRIDSRIDSLTQSLMTVLRARGSSE